MTKAGELICKVWGLLLEGLVLAYDLVNYEPDWITIRGCVSDLSQAEVASTKELSELIPWPWEQEAQRVPQVKGSIEEGPTDSNETGNGPINQESPKDSGDTCANSSVSNSEEEQGTDGHMADQESESEGSCDEKELMEEPMDK